MLRGPISRRELSFGGGLLALGAAVPSSAQTDPDFARSLAALEAREGGRLGVYVADLHAGCTLAYRCTERFKMMSSFKGLLTAMVLHEAASGRERLDATLSFGHGDLLPASPVTSAQVKNGRMTIEALCAATMAFSDNTAANLLLKRIGGPAKLTDFVRRTGDPVTRIDHYEGPGLASAQMPADSTTPRAIVGTIQQLLTGKVLAPEARLRWEAWMSSNEVGRTRLRAAFPIDWTAGDRTGTADGICNDYAFARRPGRGLLLLAAYYDAAGLSLPEQEKVLRQVGFLAVQWQRSLT